MLFFHIFKPKALANCSFFEKSLLKAFQNGVYFNTINLKPFFHSKFSRKIKPSLTPYAYLGRWIVDVWQHNKHSSNLQQPDLVLERLEKMISYEMQRHIHNSVKNLRWRLLAKIEWLLAVNYFRSTLHLRYLTRFWVRFWNALQKRLLKLLVLAAEVTRNIKHLKKWDNFKC